ncbi:MAG: FtsW/RodA/SpoVE family cell cycle protein [Armatimonadota bacterium]|nr:FtsW/RodA/SpoVE family cell cycle protein [Armatimonadota bacterium]
MDGTTPAKSKLRKYVTSRGVDPWVAGAAFLLAIFGVFAVFDASFASDLSSGARVWQKPFEHFLGILAGLVAYGVAVKMGSARLRAWAFPIFLTVLGLCFAVLLFGTDAWGARRRLWFFQPAEFMKPAMILFCAYFASLTLPAFRRKCRGFLARLDGKVVPIVVRLLPLLLIGAAFILIEREPDLGTAMIVAGIFGGMLFLGLGKTLFGRRHLWVTWGLLVAGLALVVVLAFGKGYRAERLNSFLHRWERPYVDGAGHQSALAEKAYAMSGPAGVGPLKGIAKQKLPAADTDFIFVTIAEEFGLVGGLIVIAGLAVISFRLIFLSALCTGLFPKLILAGAGWWIGLQSAFNLAVAGVLIPSVGIPLPLLSDGSSSLVAIGIALGMCQAVLAKEVVRKVSRAPSVDRGRDRWARISGA